MSEDSTQHAAPEEIVVECDLPQAPEKVWRALTEPELLALWLKPREIPLLECEVTEADTNKRLRYRWREQDDAGVVESFVTFELTPTSPGGTHLRVVHDGFNRAAQPAAGQSRSKVVALADLRASRSQRTSATVDYAPRIDLGWRRAA